MNTLIKLTCFYFINLIAFILMGVLFGSETTWLVASPRTWLFPVFVVLVGLFFGYLTISVQRLTGRSTVFNYSLTIVSTIVTLMLFMTRYSDWKHDRDFGNIIANKDYLKYSIGNNAYEKKLAFEMLSKKFASLNDFRILGNLTEDKDSSINGDTTTIYSMTYFYQKRDDNKYYKAAFTVINDKANLLSYDEVLDFNDYSKIVKFNREFEVTLTNAWRELPDSIKELIQDEFPELSE